MPSFSNLSGLQGALIGLAVVVFFIVRQFSTRPVLSLWLVIPPLALLYFGATGLAQLDAAGWLLLAINLVLGVGLGYLRGTTFRVWFDDRNTALMKGTSLTVLFWVATIAVKIVLAFVEQKAGLGLGASSGAELMIPTAATLGVQSLVVYLRAHNRRLIAA